MKPYYKDHSCVIYHGDAYDIIGELEYDVVITDPPYVVDTMGGGIER